MVAGSIRVAFTETEWARVTTLFRSDDLEDLKQAVAIFCCWRARSGLALHIAAEISDLILRSIIADKETDENDWFAIGNLLLVYNSAIIRLFFETIVSQCNTASTGYEDVSKLRDLMLSSTVLETNPFFHRQSPYIASPHIRLKSFPTVPV
ncbi:unnamed protein product [Dracunculus medinensis]|uniref:Uncharacterized protein n=1 Tax=Dracunculus medinensis TaxID=318479 RepID=A0A158Q3D7_DRAME|nr:unnamed protein product [Dracunculus medinensis]